MEKAQIEHYLDYVKAKEMARIADLTAEALKADYIARYREFADNAFVFNKADANTRLRVTSANINPCGNIIYNLALEYSDYWYESKLGESLVAAPKKIIK